MEIVRFNREFVERTKSILNEYEGEYEFSNLLNCTLGLLILPFEMVRDDRDPHWTREIESIIDFPKFTIHRFEPIRGPDRRTKEIVFCPKTLHVLLRKIRNGIAHQNIEPVNKDGIFQSVRIWNKSMGGRDVDIEFTQEELRSFASYIANLYLNLCS